MIKGQVVLYRTVESGKVDSARVNLFGSNEKTVSRIKKKIFNNIGQEYDKGKLLGTLNKKTEILKEELEKSKKDKVKIENDLHNINAFIYTKSAVEDFEEYMYWKSEHHLMHKNTSMEVREEMTKNNKSIKSKGNYTNKVTFKKGIDFIDSEIYSLFLDISGFLINYRDQNSEGSRSEFGKIYKFNNKYYYFALNSSELVDELNNLFYKLNMEYTKYKRNLIDLYTAEKEVDSYKENKTEEKKEIDNKLNSIVEEMKQLESKKHQKVIKENSKFLQKNTDNILEQIYLNGGKLVHKHYNKTLQLMEEVYELDSK